MMRQKKIQNYEYYSTLNRWHYQPFAGNYFENKYKDKIMKQPPFKVLCVSRGDYNITTRKNIASPIEVGTEYTVIGTLDSAYGTGYFIAGFGASTAFLARLFATLPSTTEEIAIECETESIIYQR